MASDFPMPSSNYDDAFFDSPKAELKQLREVLSAASRKRLTALAMLQAVKSLDAAQQTRLR